MRETILAGLACALLAVTPAPADAGTMDVGAELMLGMGGSIDVGGADVDLGVTAGFGLFWDYEIWRYLDIGVQGNVLWWKTDAAGADRDTLIDVAPFVKGKLRFVNDKLEVYGKIPIGLALNIGDDTDAGLHTGFTAGVSYNVWGGLWPFLELGWALHWIDANTSFSMNQFALQIGASWNF